MNNKGSKGRATIIERDNVSWNLDVYTLVHNSLVTKIRATILGMLGNCLVSIQHQNQYHIDIMKATSEQMPDDQV